MKIGSLTIALVACLSTIVQAQQIIEGIVLSNVDSTAVEFASVYIDEHTGTIANADGYFKLTAAAPNQTVTISHVNYEPLTLRMEQWNGMKKVVLSEKSFQLDEVAISANTAEREIQIAIRESSARILWPVVIEGYYSEFVKSNGKYEKFADGLIQYFVPKDYKDEKSIDAKVLASRAVDLKPENEATIDIASPVGVRFALRNYDIARVKKFLDSLSFQDYTYSILSDEDTNPNIVIRFAPKNDRSKFLYEGEIHIDKATQLIRYLHYRTAAETIPYGREVNAVLIKMKLMSAQGTFIFHHDPEKKQYHPSFVREVFELRMFNNKIDQTSIFTQQLQVLDIKSSERSPFKRSEEYSKKGLYRNGTTYTDAFWKKSNLIQTARDEDEIVKKVSMD